MGITKFRLVIQDRSFDQQGQLNYPVSGRPGNSWIPEFFNTILVNGKAFPFLVVEPRKYRFRILNASNARFYGLTLSSGQPFYVIGCEQGLLPAPVVDSHLLIAPAERIDLVIDFSSQAGKQITLNNDAAAPYPSSGMVVPPQVMQFRVATHTTGPDKSMVPSKLAPLPKSTPRLRSRPGLQVTAVFGAGGPFQSRIWRRPHRRRRRQHLLDTVVGCNPTA